MKLLITGSRYLTDYELVSREIAALCPALIIHGAASGADTLAQDYAEYNHIPVIQYPADWIKYGKAAGPIRNTQMLKEGKPDMVLAFLHENSRGTKHMINIAQNAGIKTKIVHI